MKTKELARLIEADPTGKAQKFGIRCVCQHSNRFHVAKKGIVGSCTRCKCWAFEPDYAAAV